MIYNIFKYKVFFKGEKTIINISKHDFYLLMLHVLKLSQNACENNRVVQRWFKKFRSRNESLEVEKGRERLCNLDN